MTDQLRQAAQQALEALIDAANVLSAPMFADAVDALRTALEQQAEPVAMRLPKVGDKVICLEDESLGTVESLTAGGSPDITFDDGSRGTYMLREFAELFGYVTAPPKREWQGLTDEQLDDVYFCAEGGVSAIETWRKQARAIETKLKERNT